MNNKKGQSVGLFIVVAIAVIFGLTLLTGSGGIASNAGTLTSTVPIVNETITFPANEGYVDRPNCVNYDGGVFSLTNSTSGVAVPASNYTVTTRVSSTTNVKVLTILAGASAFNSRSVNASYTCLPQGYAEDGATRAISPLIILFSILGILTIVITVVIKSGIVDIG